MLLLLSKLDEANLVRLDSFPSSIPLANHTGPQEEVLELITILVRLVARITITKNILIKSLDCSIQARCK